MKFFSHKIDNWIKVGNFLQTELEFFQTKYDFVKNVRGRGTLIAWDHSSTEQRNTVINGMLFKLPKL